MESNKNIAVFSLAYEPLIGGAEIALREIITRRPEYNFFIFTNKFSAVHKSVEVNGNVTILRLGSGKGLTFINKIKYPFLALQAFAEENKSKQFAFQWAMMATYAGIASLLIKYKFPQTPYLLTDQSGDSDWFLFKRTWWWRYFYKQIYRRADYIQVISVWLKNRVLKYGYKGEIKLIPNGVNVSKFSNIELSAEDRLKLKLSYGFNADDRVIISPSRLVDKNGLYWLISSAPSLPGKYKILIVGDGDLQYKLHQHALGLGVIDRVIFLKGVDHTELAKLLSISFAMCRPALTEGFGNVFVEAMAAGVPAVGTNVGGIPDIIIDKENGLLIPPKNPMALSKALLSLEDEQFRNKIIANGLQSVQKYNWDDISNEMNQIFKSLCLKKF